MKKIILTVVTIFAFVISNAQEKANHNTTRSNHSSGIMVKETGDSIDNNGEPAGVMVAFGCDNGVFTTVSVDGDGLSIDTYDWIPCSGTWVYSGIASPSRDDSNEEVNNHNELYERVKKFTKEDYARAKRIRIKFEKRQNITALNKWIEILSFNQKPNGMDNDCDAVVNNNLRELKDAEIINKSSFTTKRNNKYYIYNGNKQELEKHNNKYHQNKSALPTGEEECEDTAYFECYWSCDSCMCRLKQDCLVIMFKDDDSELLPIIEINDNTVVNKEVLIIKKGNKRYRVIADKMLIKKILDTKKNDSKWIEILSFSHGNNATKRKRNKNFNRKGERVKRTKF